MRVCHKPHTIRPERAEAFNFKAFALSGRLCFCHHTQGDALGYELLGLQPVLKPHTLNQRTPAKDLHRFWA